MTLNKKCKRNTKDYIVYFFNDTPVYSYEPFLYLSIENLVDIYDDIQKNSVDKIKTILNNSK